jgi:amino acid transporter
VYGGYDVIGVPAGEATDPRRDIPFAFIATIVLVTMVFVLAQMVTMSALPDVAASRTPMADASLVMFGAAGAMMISLGSVVSMTGNSAGQVLTGSRMLYALAENNELPRWFARVHPRYRTPANSVIFSSLVALVLMLSGSFVFLAAVSAVARLVMYLAVCMSTLVLRRRPPNEEMGPALFVIPLGPIVPVLATVVAAGILFGATTEQLAAGAAALVAGAVLFAIANRRPVATL